MKVCSHFPRIWIIFEFEVLLLQRDGVVEEELRSVFENLGDCILREVPMKRARDIGEHEGNVVGQCFGEHSGQSGQRIISADSNARDSAIGKDENGSDGVDVLLDFIRDTFLVDFILLNTSGVGQPRCIKNANLGKRLYTVTMFTSAITYYYAVFARKFVKSRGVGLALVVGTTSLVGLVKGIGVVVIDVFAVKNIGDEF